MPRLLRPSWLLLHVLLVAACIVMVKLGLWQWGRGVDTGSLRNYSYGLEWYAFAGLSVLGWVKFCYDETTGAAPPAPRVRHEAPAGLPAPQTVVPPVPEDEDPELAAWNARFAALAEREELARREERSR